jgi:hypothetical protein
MLKKFLSKKEKTEFEEKEYEGPLNHQLLGSSNNLWAPGQVFENVFGVDSALLANNILLWQQFAFPKIPKGVVLSDYRWNFLFRLANRTLRPFPSFRVNLLMQVKRPEFKKGVNRHYAKNGISGDYWQFKLTLHQQIILDLLERKLGSDALVIYACASFHKFVELEKYISHGQLVSNSTFVKPSKLVKHKKWVYDQPGTTGIASSKIEKLNDLPFEEQLQNLFSIESNRIESTFDNALIYLQKLENISIEICSELPKNRIAQEFLKRRKLIVQFLDFYKTGLNINTDALRSFISFNLFTLLLDTTWLSIEDQKMI